MKTLGKTISFVPTITQTASTTVWMTTCVHCGSWTSISIARNEKGEWFCGTCAIGKELERSPIRPAARQGEIGC